ncbi:DUF805 domain-containing protein [Fructobacillus americanaquae]|nr:DUF805 domain-containing protein [Fructobacillus americanaquae]
MRRLIQSYKKYWEDYFHFRGQTSRSEYWSVMFINSAISLLGYWLVLYLLSNLVQTVASVADNSKAYWVVLVTLVLVTFLLTVFWLLNLIPFLSISYRRYRDTGLPSWAFIIEPVAIFLSLVGYYYQTKVYESNISMPLWLIPALLVLVLADFLIKILPTGTFNKI